MRWLKVLLVLVIALVVVVVGGGLLLSPAFTVVRSTSVAAGADEVYALVADPRQWPKWSVWNRRDPAMRIAYSGAASGAGAVWEWKSESQGDGRMTFTAAEPGRRVAFELYFVDFGTTSKGELTFEPAGARTLVRWTMNGDFGRNPITRWFALFADRMVGADFEAGLGNLKALAEQ